jgi:predicted metalloprotease with PDZ domain
MLMTWIITLYILQNTILCGTVSNEKGYIGIREDWHKGIQKVCIASPADVAGICPGDKIVRVEGVAGLKEEVRGPVGSTVKITVRRGVEYLEFQVKRVPHASIDWKHRK